MAGNAPSGIAAHEAACEDALRFACARAASDDVTIVIEPIDRRDMPAYFQNDFGHAAWLVRRLALPNLKLQFDIYHRQILHGDVVRGLEAMADIIGPVQVASRLERHEPCMGELVDGRRRPDRLPRLRRLRVSARGRDDRRELVFAIPAGGSRATLFRTLTRQNRARPIFKDYFRWQA